MKFKSKIDWWVHLIVWCFVFETGNLTWRAFHAPSAGLVFCALIFWAFLLLMVFPIYFSTHYDVLDDYLCICCGLCVKLRIPYDCMCRLAPCKNPGISCALSLDRLVLVFRDPQGNTHRVLLSPKEKEEFIKQIQLKNPRISTNCGDSGCGPVVPKKKLNRET